MEHLQVDHRLSQFDISIRQYVRDGATVKEADEIEYYAARFPLTDSEQLEKQHETQMRYLFTDTSGVRIAYYLLEADDEKMVVLKCPYCQFQRKFKLQFVENQYNKVLDTGGRLVLSSSGLEVRGSGRRVHRTQNLQPNN